MTLDLVIVGAGPAGVSAALWSKSLGLSARVLEAGPSAGGQLHVVHLHPDEIAGVEKGDGPAIAAAMQRQLEASGVEVRYGRAAETITPTRSGLVVRDAAGEAHAAGAALVASGVRKRRLGVPGDRELEDRGVTYSATRDVDRLAGQRVLVVGGGDGAFENALILAGRGCDVTICFRGAPRARAEFRRQVAAEPRVRLLEQARVAEVAGDGRVERVRLETPEGEAWLEVDAVVVKIGVLPNTEWCCNLFALDGDGYIMVRPGGRTSMPRVWAAGDVTRPVVPSVSVALGSAAIAVAEIRKRRG